MHWVCSVFSEHGRCLSVSLLHDCVPLTAVMDVIILLSDVCGKWCLNQRALRAVPKHTVCFSYVMYGLRIKTCEKTDWESTRTGKNKEVGSSLELDIDHRVSCCCLLVLGNQRVWDTMSSCCLTSLSPPPTLNFAFFCTILSITVVLLLTNLSS